MGARKARPSARAKRAMSSSGQTAHQIRPSVTVVSTSAGQNSFHTTVATQAPACAPPRGRYCPPHAYHARAARNTVDAACSPPRGHRSLNSHRAQPSESRFQRHELGDRGVCPSRTEDMTFVPRPSWLRIRDREGDFVVVGATVLTQSLHDDEAADGWRVAVADDAGCEGAGAGDAAT